MPGLSDEQLLERLAEIEGQERFTPWKEVDVDSRTIYEGVIEWNPLTSDADAMALVKKYRLQLFWSEMEPPMWVVGNATDDSLNRAICLAIIEAHKEEA